MKKIKISLFPDLKGYRTFKSAKKYTFSKKECNLKAIFPIHFKTSRTKKFLYLCYIRQKMCQVYIQRIKKCFKRDFLETKLFYIDSKNLRKWFPCFNTFPCFNLMTACIFAKSLTDIVILLFLIFRFLFKKKTYFIKK